MLDILLAISPLTASTSTTIEEMVTTTEEISMAIEEETEDATEAMLVDLVEEAVNEFTANCVLSLDMVLDNAIEGLINNFRVVLHKIRIN